MTMQVDLRVRKHLVVPSVEIDHKVIYFMSEKQATEWLEPKGFEPQFSHQRVNSPALPDSEDDGEY